MKNDINFKKIKIQTHNVPEQEKKMRLQDYGVGIFMGIATKSALKKVLKKELIRVNDTLATTATFIRGGETITLQQTLKRDSSKNFHFKLDVLYEDDFLAVIHKPAGITVSGNTFKTIANALSQNLSGSSQPDACDPQPVHRLDYPTTGVLLIGKTSSSIIRLNRLFERRKVAKTYYAVSIGKMDNGGIISAILENKQAHSTYQCLQTIQSSRFGFLNLLELAPQTGRKHQLRKHLAHIGNPILGDSTYGKEPFILKGKGLYLHAYAICFQHPFQNKIITIKKMPPLKFKKLFPNLHDILA